MISALGNKSILLNYKDTDGPKVLVYNLKYDAATKKLAITNITVNHDRYTASYKSNLILDSIGKSLYFSGDVSITTQNGQQGVVGGIVELNFYESQPTKVYTNFAVNCQCALDRIGPFGSAKVVPNGEAAKFLAAVKNSPSPTKAYEFRSEQSIMFYASGKNFRSEDGITVRISEPQIYVNQAPSMLIKSKSVIAPHIGSIHAVSNDGVAVWITVDSRNEKLIIQKKEYKLVRL
ncbi:hypothetical protein GCM10023184_14530 [Flaviaesturariibacter amylovorans]|uniref:Uncharacterized protein n=2 Tax=Flaviaesturariibacter amylovorans TaxID=1084520 RepID=A0ABP8GKK3_9BACT